MNSALEKAQHMAERTIRVIAIKAIAIKAIE